MANNESDNLKSLNVNQLSGGLHSDNSPINQPKTTYRYALNTINETLEGDQTFLSNERSNEICTFLPEGYLPNGKVYINNDKIVIFSTNGTRSEIGILEGCNSCNYKTYVNNPCFNFQLCNQIDATYRLRRGCEDTIYWVDCNNEDKYFNFQKPENFYSDDYQQYLQDVANGNNPGQFDGEIWDCKKFNINREYTIPCITSAEILEGKGTLNSGTYNFAIQYVDCDQNPTNWIYSSSLVPIYVSDTTGAYKNKWGSSNLITDSLTGIGKTNKAIKITTSNLDTSFCFYRIAIIEASGFNGEVSTVYSTENILITDDTYIYDGNIEKGLTLITKEELQLKKPDNSTSCHIEQIENRLIKANTKGKQIDWCSFQSYASKIASNYFIKESIPELNSEEGDAKNSSTYWFQENYMGDEVYAFGIVYVFADGFESPVYHIPGRPLNKYYDKIQGCVDTIDDTLITEDTNTTPFGNGDKPLWQVGDTSVNYSGITSGNSYGAMQFHQNSDGVYENVIGNCGQIDYWGVDFCGNPLLNSNIRHHKFPSRNKEPHVSNNEGSYDYNEWCVYVRLDINQNVTQPSDYFTSISYPVIIDIYYFTPTDPPLIYNITLNTPEEFSIYLEEQEVFCVNSTIGITNVVWTPGDNPGDNPGQGISLSVITKPKAYNSFNQSNCTNTKLRHLGIEFFNITYPDPNIVGHYFVRGDRDEQNRTCIDGGYMFNTHWKVKSNKMDANYYGFTYFNSKYSNSAVIEDAPIDDLNNDRGIDNRNFGVLFNPKFQFLGETNKPSYIKLNNYFPVQSGPYYNCTKERVDKGSWVGLKNTWHLFTHREFNYCGTKVNSAVSQPNDIGGKNLTLDRQQPFVYNGWSSDLTGSNGKMWNCSVDNLIRILKFKDNTLFFPIIEDEHKVPYVTLKTDNDIYPNLYNIKYKRIHNCLEHKENVQKHFGGDTFITRWDLFNSFDTKYDPGNGKAILGIVAAAIATILAAVITAVTLGAGSAVFAGTAAAWGLAITAAAGTLASLIATVAYSRAAYLDAIANFNLDLLTDDSGIDGSSCGANGWSNRWWHVGENLNNIYIESEINTELRVRSNNKTEHCSDFYTGETWHIWYLRDKFLYYNNGDNKWEMKDYPCVETCRYNLDFSRENDQSLYYPLPSTYDCCSECLETHPTRVVYSEQSFQEELTDNYRTFLSNNYRDIEGETGEITDIWRYGDHLFIHTKESLYELISQFQERVTSDNLVSFIGTGEYFSVLPKKLSDGDLGVAGTQHKWATIKTKGGVFFVNQLENKVYLFNGKLTDISKLGLRNYFENNLKDFFCCQFKGLTNEDFPFCNCNSSNCGIGIHSTYDTRYERILLTKRDYLLLPEFTSNFKIITNSTPINELIVDQVYWNAQIEKFSIFNGITLVDTNFENEDYFENKSWTISFSFHNERFISWHSYLPNFYIENQSHFYSFTNSDTGIWKHNVEHNFQTFYGKYYPHIIEYVSISSALITRIWEDITFNTIAKKYDPLVKENLIERYITYNKLITYNEEQCTGEIEMIVKDTELNEEDYLFHQVIDRLNNQQIIINREERNWNINDLRDLRVDYDKPIFNTTWNNIKNNYPIDKELNLSTINYNKDWSELQQMRDKHLIIRIIFDKFDNINLIFNYSIETEQQSFR